MDELYEDERIDYATVDESLKIIQSASVFSFSLDAVLLADFAYLPIKRGQILDIGTGNGIIPLLLTRRTAAHITGVEIQPRLADMAHRNVNLNRLDEHITIIEDDLKALHSVIGHSRFDVVTCNPPYFATPNVTEHNHNDSFTIARHEVYCTLEDVIKACKLHVKPGGKVSMVHRPGRLMDILTLFRAYKLEPKRLRFIYPKQGRAANMLLIEGVRDGKADLDILPPLYIYQASGDYTEEAGAIIRG